MKKKLFAAMLSTVLVASSLLAGCGDDGGSVQTSGGGGGNNGTSASGGILKSVETFSYPSLDVHKEYYSWHDQKYGLSETLFKINDDMELEPWLAEKIEIDGTKCTVTLKDGVCFSNGNPLTADMAKRNFERLIEVNNRFKYMADWTFEAPDEKTLVITTQKVYPTFKNDFATPETGFIDLDATTDFDKNPICTGPFAVDTFVPSGDITLKKNENYWGGEVKLDGAVFYAMSDDQSKLMAMQNGEIDAYDNISSSDIELFSADPDTYSLYSVPMQMRSYMFLNSERVPNSIRQAIGLVIDRKAIADFLPGMISPTYSVFDSHLAYGKAKIPSTDVEKAKQIMEADGYTLTNGVYTKDGQPAKVVISCYASRNIDTQAVLIQEQLNAFGITAEIALKEDPDGSYMSDHDYEICFYRMITDKTGDPFPFIDGVVKSGSYQDIAGFGNEETDALIEELRYEVDTNRRAELTNEIMQKFYDSNTFVIIANYNRNIVLRKGVTGFSESNPYEFYGINADSSVNG